MIIYSREDGSFPTPKELGLKDFEHDKDGKYVGSPLFIPIGYKDRIEDYYRDMRVNRGREYVGACSTREEQRYKDQMTEAAYDNFSWGRNLHAERCANNREYEDWLENWN